MKRELYENVFAVKELFVNTFSLQSPARKSAQIAMELLFTNFAPCSAPIFNSTSHAHPRPGPGPWDERSVRSLSFE